MNNYVWILCKTENGNGKFQNSKLGKLLHRIYIHIFAKPTVEELSLTNTGSFSTGYLVRVPWYRRDIQEASDRKVARLGNNIARLLADKEVRRAYPESNILEREIFTRKLGESGIQCSSCGFDLFAALTGEMIGHAAQKRRKEICRMYITVLVGEEIEAVKTLILYLAPLVGFVTIAGRKCEEMEAWLENVCDDTGLCIRETLQVADAVRESDVFISFEGKRDRDQYKQKAGIYYYHGRYEFTPYGIEIDFTDIIYNHYMEELVMCYGTMGVAEVLLDSMLSGNETLEGNNGTYDFPSIKRMNLLKNRLEKISLGIIHS